jgi:hypothetical protein
MTSADRCTLSITVSTSDVAFLPYTIPHIVRMCRGHNFYEKVLFVDDKKQSGDFINRESRGHYAQLLELCEEFKKIGIIDRFLVVDYSKNTLRSIFTKHFGRDIRFTHDYRGAPILGYLYSVEATETDFVLHFDSDMLIFSKDFDWVSELISYYNQYPEILFILPRSGAPTRGRLKKVVAEYTEDPRGLYLFKDSITARYFMVSKKRLGLALPINPSTIIRRRFYYELYDRYLSDTSYLSAWEDMVGKAMKSTSFFRADLISEACWTLHPTDHGQRFLRFLPEIIERLESGCYPPSQEGDYDLVLEDWIDMIGSTVPVRKNPSSGRTGL